MKAIVKLRYGRSGLEKCGRKSCSHRGIADSYNQKSPFCKYFDE